MKTLVTGGAGFIGCHSVDRFLSRGLEVVVYDDLSRPGSSSNLDWLRERHGDSAFQLVQADIRDADRLRDAVRDVDVVLHLAGQVAVTSSVLDPRHDFEVNALGTFNALEAARRSKKTPIFLYSSTNKVYGGMEDVVVEEGATRHRFRDLPGGISEERPLDFHSPYGCSKGAGDQYVRDYARIYSLRSVVFRQSAIYGTRQFGVEDQGWIAWLTIAAVTGKPITIYGDGKQVRDVLWISDLVDLYELAIDRIDTVEGEVFNVGGGPANALSVWLEFGPLLRRLLGREVDVTFSDWRPGDQRIYVSDVTKARERLGWKPTITPDMGTRLLYEWVAANPQLFG